MASKTLSIVALVFSILIPLVGLILGIVALTRTKKGEPGHGMALAAVIIGAILTVLAPIIFIIAGSLAYYAVLDPAAHIPSQCSMSAGITCDSYAVSGSTVDLQVTNHLGRTIDISSGSLTEPTSSVSCSLSASATLANGTSARLSFTGCPSSGSQSMQHYKIDLGYAYSGGFATPRTVTGDLFVKR